MSYSPYFKPMLSTAASFSATSALSFSNLAAGVSDSSLTNISSTLAIYYFLSARILTFIWYMEWNINSQLVSTLASLVTLGDDPKVSCVFVLSWFSWCLIVPGSKNSITKSLNSCVAMLSVICIYVEYSTRYKDTTILCELLHKKPRSLDIS